MTLLTAPAHADPTRSDQWHLRNLQISDAHIISTGNGVIVGIIDTGVSPHVDLRRNLLLGTDIKQQNGSNGQRDRYGHGTEMAGLIAAHGRNGHGVLGIAPSAKILPVRITNAIGEAGSLDIAAGISWAATHSAKIINVSAVSGPTLALKDAVGIASNNDVLVVAGTGNKPHT